MTRPLIVAHRGYSGKWPENTVASARAAIAAGADLVEADVRFSADGTLFCFHDPDLSRLTGEDVRISDCPDPRLAALRIGGEPAATLTDILAEVAGRAGLLIDVKLGTSEITAALARALEDAGWPEGVWLGLRSATQTAEARGLLGAKVRVLAFSPGLEQTDAFLSAGADAVRVWERDLDAPEAAALRDRAPVWITAGHYQGRAPGDADAPALARIRAFRPAAVLLNDPTLLAAVAS